MFLTETWQTKSSIDVLHHPIGYSYEYACRMEKLRKDDILEAFQFTIVISLKTILPSKKIC